MGLIQKRLENFLGTLPTGQHSVRVSRPKRGPGESPPPLQVPTSAHPSRGPSVCGLFVVLGSPHLPRAFLDPNSKHTSALPTPLWVGTPVTFIFKPVNHCVRRCTHLMVSNPHLILTKMIQVSPFLTGGSWDPDKSYNLPKGDGS